LEENLVQDRFRFIRDRMKRLTWRKPSLRKALSSSVNMVEASLGTDLGEGGGESVELGHVAAQALTPALG
jgi:hypothetical protein